MQPVTVEIDVDAPALRRLLGATPAPEGAPTVIPLSCPARLTRTGRALRLVGDERAHPASPPDPTLLRLITQARSWWVALAEGTLTMEALAAREKVSPPTPRALCGWRSCRPG